MQSVIVASAAISTGVTMPQRHNMRYALLEAPALKVGDAIKLECFPLLKSRGSYFKPYEIVVWVGREYASTARFRPERTPAGRTLPYWYIATTTLISDLLTRRYYGTVDPRDLAGAQAAWSKKLSRLADEQNARNAARAKTTNATEATITLCMSVLPDAEYGAVKNRPAWLDVKYRGQAWQLRIRSDDVEVVGPARQSVSLRGYRLFAITAACVLIRDNADWAHGEAKSLR
jgi:hypothetical protein